MVSKPYPSPRLVGALRPFDSRRDLELNVGSVSRREEFLAQVNWCACFCCQLDQYDASLPPHAMVFAAILLNNQ